MNVISIDQSTRSTGVYCRIDGKNYFLSLTYDPTVKHDQVLASVHDFFFDRCKTGQYDVAFIEGYSLASKSRSTHTQPEIGGAIKAACISNGVPVITIGIMMWKWLTIGHALKKPKDDNEADEYVKAVNKEYGIQCYSPDEADAFMMYYATVQIMTGKCDITKARAKIRDQIKEIKEKRK